ncbi:MAG: fused MFS/spermidine synthase, partial [Acidobacteria bacterium]|nr:fused MFS/spermidine synthase [Acidobacteriota bacterium]
MSPAFGLAIALGACLLFQVQFLLAKLVLPWFGGSASVWSTCLVVFQALLLAGYLYAHALARIPSRQGQVRRHLGLLLVVAALLVWRAAVWPSPVTPGPDWRPDPDASPVVQIVLLLSGAVGLPFVLLASTSPLLLRWSADLAPGRSPYRLYALSNLGSLVGLVSYPFLVEPRLDVFQQGRWWTIGYLAYLAAIVVCIRAVGRVPVRVEDSPAIEEEPTEDERRTSPAATSISAPTRGEQALWLALGAAPAAMLQATTTRITQDVAAVPFLWMLPLALYLLTFILAFEFPRLYRRHLLALAVAVTAGVALPEWSTRVTLVALLGMLAVGGLSLHGELAARAPAPRWLTRFFLLVSAGGVIGSALVALGAPLIFDGVVEYPLTLMAAVLALAAVYVTDATTQRDRTARRGPLLVALALAIIGAVIAGHTAQQWFGLTRDAIFTSRSFFGAIRVREGQFENGERYRRLQHGTTLHGLQYLSVDKSTTPTTYYTQESGVGQAMAALSALGRPAHLGVVGLGTGTLAAYGRRGDVLTVFEIDPQVVALSTAPTPIFRYLRESEASVTIVGGDARLSLERATPYRFDVLAIDAFSGDAVPVHLLTREAFRLYARH